MKNTMISFSEPKKRSTKNGSGIKYKKQRIKICPKDIFFGILGVVLTVLFLSIYK